MTPTAASTAGAGGFAGVIGRMFVSQCWASGSVGGNAKGGVGGFVGGTLSAAQAAGRPGEIRDCWSSGSVSAQGVSMAGSPGREVGGFVGSINGNWPSWFVSSVSLAPTVTITVNGDARGGGFVGGHYSESDARNLNVVFSGCWWLDLAGNQDAGYCTYPTYNTACVVGSPATSGFSQGPSPNDLYGIESAELPADTSLPANWDGLDFSPTGAWAMADNSGSLASYAGPVPVLKIQCGAHGVTCP